MSRARFSAAAVRDLQGIYDFGLERFGEATAERYAAMLTAKVALLLEAPLIGTQVPDRAKPLRRFSAESHAIYYRSTPDGIFVTRILHGAMDVRRHLK